MATLTKVIADAYYLLYLYGNEVEDLLSRTRGTRGHWIRTDMLRAVQDNADENYDTDWFGLVATPGIERQIPWEEVARLVEEMCADDVIASLFV